MTKKNFGIFLIVFPLPLLILTLAAFAVFSFVISSMASSGTDMVAIAAIVRVVLGLVGIVAVLGFLIGIPVGIFLLVSANRVSVETKTNEAAYAGLTDEQKRFVTGASLGAFLSPFVWGLANGLYMEALLSVVPIYGLYQWIKLTVSGKRMAWETGKFATFAAFKKRQLIALIVGAMFTVLGVTSQVFSSSTKQSQPDLPTTKTNSEFTAHFQQGYSDAICPLTKDTDGDGLSDTFEDLAGTDSAKADTDGDGFSDGQELASGYPPGSVGLFGPNDNDADGLFDAIELTFYGTTVTKTDTDGDGVNDGAEVRAKTNPVGSGPAPDFLKNYLDKNAKLRAQADCQP